MCKITHHLKYRIPSKVPSCLPSENKQNCIEWLLCVKLHTQCPLLIAFANSLNPDPSRQNVGPDLDPNCLAL